MTKLLAATLLLLVVGCTAVVEAKRPTAQSEGAQWLESEAQSVVWRAVWDRATSCNGNAITCYFNDPVLVPFTAVQDRFRSGAVSLLLEGGTWSSTYQSSCKCWAVYGQMGDSDPYLWVAHENNGLVFGQVPGAN